MGVIAAALGEKSLSLTELEQLYPRPRTSLAIASERMLLLERIPMRRHRLGSLHWRAWTIGVIAAASGEIALAH
jgi:hypothetical protein